VDEEADEEAKEKRSNMAVLLQFSVGTYDPLMSLLFPLIVDAKRRGSLSLMPHAIVAKSPLCLG
jgi:hypothetical protein